MTGKAKPGPDTPGGPSPATAHSRTWALQHQRSGAGTEASVRIPGLIGVFPLCPLRPPVPVGSESSPPNARLGATCRGGRERVGSTQGGDWNRSSQRSQRAEGDGFQTHPAGPPNCSPESLDETARSQTSRPSGMEMQSHSRQLGDAPPRISVANRRLTVVRPSA